MVIKFPRLSQYPFTTGQCSKGACGFISTLSSLRCCSITTALCTLSTPNVHTLHPLRTLLCMIILYICILHLHFPNLYLRFLGHVILHIPILHFRPLRLLLPCIPILRTLNPSSQSVTHSGGGDHCGG
jgi:hypothetical protein